MLASSLAKLWLLLREELQQGDESASGVGQRLHEVEDRLEDALPDSGQVTGCLRGTGDEVSGAFFHDYLLRILVLLALLVRKLEVLEVLQAREEVNDVVNNVVLALTEELDEAAEEIAPALPGVLEVLEVRDDCIHVHVNLL